jgi:hypothetical protein
MISQIVTRMRIYSKAALIMNEQEKLMEENSLEILIK